LVNPNFAGYAANCGAVGIRVTKKENLVEAINKALEYNGPALVEILTDVNLI